MFIIVQIMERNSILFFKVVSNIKSYFMESNTVLGNDESVLGFWREKSPRAQKLKSDKILAHFILAHKISLVSWRFA